MKTISNIKRKILLPALALLMVSGFAEAKNDDKMKKRILFVVTSHDKKGDTGEPTGFYLSEVSHPWEILTNAGYEIDFVSPKGGKAPIDGFNLSDETNKKFWENTTYRNKIEHTMKPSEVNPKNYVAIHYAGGHGTMWDFADNKELAQIASKIYENNGIVSAVCHGPAGLVNIRLSDGKYLVDGKKINAFTNEEETAVKLDKVVPFLLESKLVERGAKFEKSGLWQTHVVVDNRVVTGQNPQSAKAVGQAVAEELQKATMAVKMTQFEINASDEAKFRKALADYVNAAISHEANIMAEAHSEKDRPTLLWLIERWNSASDLETFQKSASAKALKTLVKSAKATKFYDMKDVEPLTKKQWRAEAEKADQPMVILLFVDGKKGTEQDFKDKYKVAMPQFRSEPGVIAYGLSEMKSDATQFVTYEKFRGPGAFDYHLNFPPVKPILNYLETSIENPPFQNGLHTLVEFAPALKK